MTERLFIASVFQETNLFSPIATTLGSFDIWRAGDGAPTIDLLGFGAVWDAARALGVVVIPSLFASATPAGPMPAPDWQAMKDEILRDLAVALPVDMVFLFLHGAQSAQGTPDCEGDLVDAVRAMVGAHVPIAVELDLHGNISQRLIDSCDIIAACKEYPHTDFAEIGRRLFALLLATVHGDARPVIGVARTPLLAIAPTTTEPIASVVAALRATEAEPDVLIASALYGFFGADGADVGGAVIVVTNGNPAKADSLAFRLAGQQAAAVQALPALCLDVDAALNQAFQTAGTVVLADRSDNPGGGAAGDSTYLLEALLKRGATDCALGMIWDTGVVEQAHSAGEGTTIDVTIGGKAGPLSGRPVMAQARVMAVRHAICQSRFGVGAPTEPIGPSAWLRIEGIDVVVNTRRAQIFSREAFTGHGIDLARQKLIVVKSTQHFLAQFGSLGRVIYCDAPGTVTQDLASLPYRDLRRPLFPIDPDPIVPWIMARQGLRKAQS